MAMMHAGSPTAFGTYPLGQGTNRTKGTSGSRLQRAAGGVQNGFDGARNVGRRAHRKRFWVAGAMEVSSRQQAGDEASTSSPAAAGARVTRRGRGRNCTRIGALFSSGNSGDLYDGPQESTVRNSLQTVAAASARAIWMFCVACGRSASCSVTVKLFVAWCCQLFARFSVYFLTFFKFLMP